MWVWCSLSTLGGLGSRQVVRWWRSDHPGNRRRTKWCEYKRWELAHRGNTRGSVNIRNNWGTMMALSSWRVASAKTGRKIRVLILQLMRSGCWDRQVPEGKPATPSKLTSPQTHSKTGQEGRKQKTDKQNSQPELWQITLVSVLQWNRWACLKLRTQLFNVNVTHILMAYCKCCFCDPDTKSLPLERT